MGIRWKAPFLLHWSRHNKMIIKIPFMCDILSSLIKSHQQSMNHKPNLPSHCWQFWRVRMLTARRRSNWSWNKTEGGRSWPLSSLAPVKVSPSSSGCFKFRFSTLTMTNNGFMVQDPFPSSRSWLSCPSKEIERTTQNEIGLMVRSFRREGTIQQPNPPPTQ